MRLLVVCILSLGLGIVATRVCGDEGNKKQLKIEDLIKDLKSKDDVIRHRAVKALGRLGHKARKALAALQTMAKSDPDEDVREAAEKAVLRIDIPDEETAVARVLLKAFQEEKDSQTARGRAEALGKCGAAAKDAVEPLIKKIENVAKSRDGRDGYLDDSSMGEDLLAYCKALGGIGSVAESAVPALVDVMLRTQGHIAPNSLREPVAIYRETAAQALGQLRSPKALAALRAVALSDKDEKVKKAAEDAIKAIKDRKTKSKKTDKPNGRTKPK